MESILEEHDGDILTNIKITTKTSVFLVFGAVKLSITCDVWRIASEPVGLGKAPERRYTIDEIGTVAFARDQTAPMSAGGAK